MSAVTSQTPSGRPPRLRWTGEEFDYASEAGVFDSRRVELIDGDILEMLPMNDPHGYSVQLGTYLLIRLFSPDKFTVRVQLPLRLGDSRPLPDFAVVIGSPAENDQHPRSALLIIEVSDTTLEFDQTEKAQLYAAHGVPDYWIADLNAKRIEVRRKPVVGEGGKASYSEFLTVSQDQMLSPLAAPDLSIRVKNLVP
jgi:Uma2 family endonuclease